jgi:uncharacterized protein (TIGR00645 family)
MEKQFAALLLATRWMLMPLYLALLVTVAALYLMVGRELVHLLGVIMSADESEMLLIILGVLDMVLVANLLVMVAISSYESFVSRIVAAPGDGKPEWLGKMDSGDVKVKVGLSIVMISAIHLLRSFMMDADRDKMMTMAGVHIVFVLSTIALAYIDRMHHADAPKAKPGHGES